MSGTRCPGAWRRTACISANIRITSLKLAGAAGWYLVGCAVFVVLQTFGLGCCADQVHYQSQECEGGRQQRVGVEKLNCQIQSRIPENIQN